MGSCTGTNNNLAAGLNGNRTSVTDNGTLTQSACYDAADRLTSYGLGTTTWVSRINTPTAPLDWWRLGEATGTVATATNGGTGVNGTYSATGVTLNQPGAPAGDTNTAVNLSGGNISLPTTTLQGSGKTFGLWFKTTNNGVLLSKNSVSSGTPSTAGHNPMLYVDTAGKLRGRVWPSDGTSNTITTTQNVNDGTWHHVLYAVSASTQSLYLDGTLVGSQTGTVDDASWGYAFAYVGTGQTFGWPATTGTWMPFNGSIDELTIYNSVFTAANVTAMDNPTPTGTVTPSYDYRGNTTNINGDTYTFDAAGRHLTTVHGTTTVTYTRDATSSIVARTDSATGVTVRYSGAAVLNTSNVVVERTISLPGGVLVTKRPTGDVWSYPNLHGDVVATANSTGVKQGATLAYDPYGNTLGTVVDNSNGNWDYGWEGQHTKGLEHASSVTPVVEMGSRIYNPALGRFLSVDPIEGGTPNDYSYPADPTNEVDLTGESTCHVFQTVYTISKVIGYDSRGRSTKRWWGYSRPVLSVPEGIVTGDVGYLPPAVYALLHPAPFPYFNRTAIGTQCVRPDPPPKTPKVRKCDKVGLVLMDILVGLSGPGGLGDRAPASAEQPVSIPGTPSLRGLAGCDPGPPLS